MTPRPERPETTMTQSALGHEIVHTPKTLETVEAVRAVCADILEGSPYSLTVEPHDLGGATIRLNASWYGNRAEWKAIWGQMNEIRAMIRRLGYLSSRRIRQHACYQNRGWCMDAVGVYCEIRAV